MNPIKFYDIYINPSFIVSSFMINSKKDISKLKSIKIKIIFKNIIRITPTFLFLCLCIFTKTKPILIKGLKNYKENKTSLKGIFMQITKFKYFFLNQLTNDFLIENRDAIKKLKKAPYEFNNLILDKLLIHNSTDNLFELSNVNRNSQNINIIISFGTENKKNNLSQNFFLFNSLINKNFLPRVLS